MKDSEQNGKLNAMNIIRSQKKLRKRFSRSKQKRLMFQQIYYKDQEIENQKSWMHAVNSIN
jgi:hypothetical protein